MDVLTRFGRRIRELRRAKGWSEEDLAEECGVRASYVIQVERGEREVRILDIDRISRALGLPISELLEGADRSSE